MSFTHYSPVTVQAGQVPSTQTDFPMLVSYTDNRFKSIANGGRGANANGYDNRTYSDSGLTTALPYELERSNVTTGELVLWVKVPSLADGSIIYVANGDAALTTDGSSASTWNSDFKGVWHLRDGTTLGVLDSTSNANHGTNNGATATAGKVDGAASFNGSNQNIGVGSGASLAIVGDLTISAWVSTAATGDRQIFCAHEPGSPYKGYAFGINETGVAGRQVFYRHGSGWVGGTSTSINNGSLRRIAVTLTGTAVAFYLDGTADGTATSGAPDDSGTTKTIGSATGGGDWWSGVIDELRVSAVARTANWIATEYNNMSAPGTFATLGTEVANGGQSVAVGPAVASWSGVAPTPSLGGLSVAAGPAAGAWAGIAPSPSLGALSVAASPALGTWAGLAPTPALGGLTVTAGPAVGTWSSVAPAVLIGGLSVPPGIALGSWQGVDLGAAFGAITAVVTPALGSWSGVAPTPFNGISLSVSPAIGAWSALAPTPAMTLSQSVGPALASWGGVVVTVQPGVLAIVVAPALGTWSALGLFEPIPITSGVIIEAVAWRRFSEAIRWTTKTEASR